MKLKRFFGLTSRAVLEQVRNELGPDAMIIANRSTAEGVEVDALAGDAVAALAAMDAGTGAPPPATPAQRAPAATSPGPLLTRAETADTTRSAQATAMPATDAALSQVREDVAGLRTLLETQLSQLAWTDTLRRNPQRARLMRELLTAGYSPALARELTQSVDGHANPGDAFDALTRTLASRLDCTQAVDDVVTRGGVYALVGPTGVGKTTTTAKLAARCAVRYGAGKLALLTTDSYRVGAQDQLRIYARILGVAVHTVSDRQDFRQALDSLRGKHLVLIDTVGMGQRDSKLGEQAALLAQPEVQRLLLLNAAAQAQTLEEVVRIYRRQPEHGAPIRDAGIVITKLDEAVQIAPVIDVAIRHGLPLSYISAGQRVPEDLHAPNSAYLVHRSLRARASAAFALEDDEAYLVDGAGAMCA
ncbi:MAG TPA: flagellar biosynthesis protein FlhF [Casimicrobiaceae bacterium]|nr:flagellar biosynthesis protein FlhF [Casimicrobiaceae bacterium]